MFLGLFWGAFPEVFRPVSSSDGALSLSFSRIYRSFGPPLRLPRLLYLALFLRSFLPLLLVIFRLCFVCSGSCSLGFLYHVLRLSLSAFALSLSILVLLSVLLSDLFQFLFPSGCSLSYFQGFQFGSCCGSTFCISVARFGVHIFFIVVRLL